MGDALSMTGLERFQKHLRELLQLDDTADLDFGIYRLFSYGVMPPLIGKPVTIGMRRDENE